MTLPPFDGEDVQRRELRRLRASLQIALDDDEDERLGEPLDHLQDVTGPLAKVTGEQNVNVASELLASGAYHAVLGALTAALEVSPNSDSATEAEMRLYVVEQRTSELAESKPDPAVTVLLDALAGTPAASAKQQMDWFTELAAQLVRWSVAVTEGGGPVV